MNTLSSQPYKGTRDWYPEDKRIQNYIFSTWKNVAQRYGYQEYGAPLLEPIEIYRAKSGDELADEQTYQFTDRGDRSVAIRPEMTPTISRMVAARRQELAYPARLFSIANFMRYERPQRGREREFWQLNVDVFGVESIYADAEIVSLGADIMNAFGADSSMYTIRINNRDVIRGIMHDYLGLDDMAAAKMIKLFDRKNKISLEEFEAQAAALFPASNSETGFQKVQNIVNADSIDSLPDEVIALSAISEVKQLLSLLASSGVSNATFDATLMRGLDYYTGTVFEFFDIDPENNRSLFGGGRYDGLVGLFGAEPLSAVGFAPGLTTTELFLRSHNLLPSFTSLTDIYIAFTQASLFDEGVKLATTLREAGIAVEVDLSGKKLEKQLRSASKKNVRHLLVLGDDEIASGRYKLKNLDTGREFEGDIDTIITYVRQVAV